LLIQAGLRPASILNHKSIPRGIPSDSLSVDNALTTFHGLPPKLISDRNFGQNWQRITALSASGRCSPLVKGIRG
jgi:hypothetical protein